MINGVPLNERLPTTGQANKGWLPWVVSTQIWSYDIFSTHIQLEKEITATENSARTTIAQIIRGVVILLDLYFTYQNARTAQQNLRIEQENLVAVKEQA